MGQIKDQPTPVRVFLEVVRSWVDTIDNGGLHDANSQSNLLKAHGELLAHDPEFRRLFIENLDSCDERDPEQVLKCIYAFFKALNDAALSGRYRNPKRIV